MHCYTNHTYMNIVMQVAYMDAHTDDRDADTHDSRADTHDSRADTDNSRADTHDRDDDMEEVDCTEAESDRSVTVNKLQSKYNNP